MSLPPKLAEFLDDLAFFPDRADRIQFLISLADRFQSASGRELDAGHKVPACESEAYGWVDAAGGELKVEFAVLNPQGISAMAMAVILQESLNGEPLSAAALVPDDLPYQIFGSELSMGKSAGLMGMVGLVKFLAAKQA